LTLVFPIKKVLICFSMNTFYQKMVSIQDGIVIKEKRARHVVPAEMEKFTVEIQDLISTNELSIEMEILA